MKKTLSFALPVLLASTALATPPISDLAPESTVFIVGVKNAETACQRFQRTGIWDLWKSEEMTEMFADLTGDMEERIDEMLKDLGLERDTLQPPTGELGYVVFTAMNEELGTPGPGFLLVADYGENADKTAELIDAAIAKAEEEEDLEYDEQEIMGRTVRVFDIAPEEAAVEEGSPPEMNEFGGDLDPVEAFAATMKKAYFLREGSAFILCSDYNALVGALETFEGEESPGLGEREDYRAIMENIGENDAYAALLFRDMAPLAAVVDPMGMSMMIVPMLKQFVGDVKGLGGGVRLDGEKAMIEETWFVHMPNGKTGLTALLDTQTPRGELPAFVGPNAIGYSMTNFEFDGVPDLINQVLQMLPMLAPPPAQPDAPSPQEMIAQAFSCLGSEVHVVETLDRPITMDSIQQVYAIECVKEQEFENLISGMGEMAPLEGRDFLGYRIYTMDADALPIVPMPDGPGMGAPQMQSMSIGIAGGHVYAGVTGGVEQALRCVGQAGEGGLAEESTYQRALGVLSEDEAVCWGYASIVDAAEAQVTLAKLQMEQFIEQIRAEDPEWAKEMEEMGMLEMDPLWEKLSDMDWDLMRRHVGPTVWETFATENGFLGRIFILSAEKE